MSLIVCCFPWKGKSGNVESIPLIDQVKPVDKLMPVIPHYVQFPINKHVYLKKKISDSRDEILPTPKSGKNLVNYTLKDLDNNTVTKNYECFKSKKAEAFNLNKNQILRLSKRDLKKEKEHLIKCSEFRKSKNELLTSIDLSRGRGHDNSDTKQKDYKSICHSWVKNNSTNFSSVSSSNEKDKAKFIEGSSVQDGIFVESNDLWFDFESRKSPTKRPALLNVEQSKWAFDEKTYLRQSTPPFRASVCLVCNKNHFNSRRNSNDDISYNKAPSFVCKCKISYNNNIEEKNICFEELLRKEVITADDVQRPLNCWLGKLQVQHVGVLLTTIDNEKWLIHKAKTNGTMDTTITAAETMTQNWKVRSSKVVIGRTLGDFFYVSGSNYNLLTNNCWHARNRMMKLCE